MIDVPNITAFYSPAEKLFIRSGHIHTFFRKCRGVKGSVAVIRFVNSYGNNCIKIKTGSGFFLHGFMTAYDRRNA